ncbi:putative ferric-chelate reductase 1 [Watersipora subatra]|uniref:putative ferric-chelate reductase 1 n=1 Tax=Watersipora subatra TaxID=2589382 RepID=UPI00355AEDAE
MLQILLLACLLAGVHATSDGALDGSCTNANMAPGHGTNNAAGQESPYGITLSADQYSAGGSIVVTLQGSESFKGFLVMALPADNSQGSPVGSFEALNSTQANLVKPLCTDDKGMTHTIAFKESNHDKIELKWNAPSSLAGNLIFYATFVKEYSRFWIKLPSTPVWDGVSAQPTTALPNAGGVTDPPALNPSVSYTGCGNTKGCYSDCQADGTCGFLVTWKKLTDTTVEFEMFGTLTDSQGYLALGLAPTATMTDVSVIACTADDQRESKVEQFFAASKSAGSAFVASGPISGQNNVAAVQTSTGTKSMSCRFTYDNAAAKTDLDKWKDLDKKLYIFVARGGYVTQTLLIHDAIPKIIPDAYQMTDDNYPNVGGSKVNMLIKAHACIMVLAWVFCASAGIILSRYYKPMWPNTKAWGQKVWFSYHRILMLAAMFLCVAGFIIIVVNAKDFPVPKGTGTSDDAHPILGLIVVIGSLLNPIIAAFRCGPQDSKRPIFNWAHWGIGTATHIFAIVAIFLGMLLQSSAVPEWITYVMMAFCLFHVCIEIILEIHQCSMHAENRARQDQHTANGKKGDAPPHAGSRFKCAILVVYMIVVVAITVTLIVVIVTGKSADEGNTA